MESKVKIWGKEISKCNDCDYCYYSQYEDYKCTQEPLRYTGYIEPKEIHKDCPFLQPITKEVIENYGFIKTMEWLNNSNVYKNHPFFMSFNDDKFTIFTISAFVDTEGKILFQGTINNPIEFEFILKSVGVIE